MLLGFNEDGLNSGFVSSPTAKDYPGEKDKGNLILSNPLQEAVGRGISLFSPVKSDRMRGKLVPGEVWAAY